MPKAPRATDSGLRASSTSATTRAVTWTLLVDRGGMRVAIRLSMVVTVTPRSSWMP